MRPFHVGDSGILVAGQRGRVKLTIIEHSPVGYAVEAGLLGEDEALYHEERNLVSNIVGTSSMRIDVGPIVRLAVLDTIVLSSDGLTDNLMGEEIIAIARRGPLLRATDALVTAAQLRMQGEAPDLPSKSDDLTVITFRRNRPEKKR